MEWRFVWLSLDTDFSIQSHQTFLARSFNLYGERLRFGPLAIFSRDLELLIAVAPGLEDFQSGQNVVSEGLSRALI